MKGPRGPFDHSTTQMQDTEQIQEKPPLKVLQYLIMLRPALPMSREKPCTPTSNSELRRWCNDRSVIINGKPMRADEEVEFPVDSLVFFPKSEKNRCTIV